MHLKTFARIAGACSVGIVTSAYLACLVMPLEVHAQPGHDSELSHVGGLWAHDDLFAWGISIDSKSRTAEERAQMLERLGIRQLAYSWQGKSAATFDQEAEIFRRHGIAILACAVTDTNKPGETVDWRLRRNQELGVEEGRIKPAADAMTVGELLEAFKHHHIAPQLWLMRNMQEATSMRYPKEPFDQWTDDEKNRRFRNLVDYDPTSPEQRGARVRQEARRIQALAELAAPYHVQVGLYKHGGWIGTTDNQVAIVEHLKAQGVHNVGIVYQFIHAHDEVEETVDFPAVWKKLEPHVLAVNITGLHAGRTTIYPVLYPSQGEVELGMMRIIQHSGWRGPVGLSSEKGGDAEINLRNNLIGLDWIAAELAKPGSGGTRPFASDR